MDRRKVPILVQLSGDQANIVRECRAATKRRHIIRENQMTSVPGVFAGGDSPRGPGLVVHAARDARKAAQAIHHRLSAVKVV